jgi:hypothetical protein
MKKIFLIIFLGNLFFPLAGLAGTYIGCESIDKNGNCIGPHDIYYDGIIPCGKKVCEFDPGVDGAEHCLDEKGNDCAGKKGAEVLDCCLSHGYPLINRDCSLNNTACGEVGGSVVYKDANDNGKCDENEYFRCTFCHFFVMLDGAIDFVLFKIVPPLAILMLVIGGVMFILGYFAGGGEGEPKMFGQAKKLITSVFIGLIIIFAAWLIITVFFTYIGVSSTGPLKELATDPTKWAQINCPIELPSP